MLLGSFVFFSLSAVGVILVGFNYFEGLADKLFAGSFVMGIIFLITSVVWMFRKI